jgi:hypothetical protein
MAALPVQFRRQNLDKCYRQSGNLPSDNRQMQREPFLDIGCQSLARRKSKKDLVNHFAKCHTHKHPGGAVTIDRDAIVGGVHLRAVVGGGLGAIGPGARAPAHKQGSNKRRKRGAEFHKMLLWRLALPGKQSGDTEGKYTFLCFPYRRKPDFGLANDSPSPRRHERVKAA